MGLKRFDYKLPGERKNYKSIVLVLSICMIAVLSFTSYALYQVQDKKDIVNSKVGEFNTSDVSLAILIDGVKSDSFPSKTSGKSFEKIECTNSGKAEWDSANWKLSIIEISGPTECTVSFKEGENAVTKLTELAKTNTTEMFTDDTEDANIRYMGKDPSNYVDIGNGYYSEDLYYGYAVTGYDNGYEEYSTLEACQTGINSNYKTNCTKIHSKGDQILWRVIGVMNNVDDGTGKKETRLKAIREEAIGRYAFTEPCSDSEINAAGTECTTFHYNNDYATSNIKDLLNNAYYNKTTMSSYNMYLQGKVGKPLIDFTKEGINNEMKALVENAVYYLGKVDNQTGATNSTYHQEKTGSNTWTGKVGLMYPSDYGYATSGGIDPTKAVCTTSNLYYWDDGDGYVDCQDNDWIYKLAGYRQMTMSPSTDSNKAIGISGSYQGYVMGGTTSNRDIVRPVVYLKSNVKIIGGEGTKTNPYKIGI